MKRILVPIDFSDATPPVIDLARQLAKGLDAEIHLVHVKELSAAAAPGALGYGLAGMPELAPMSGVPVRAFDLCGSQFRRMKVRDRSSLNGKEESLNAASRSHCMSQRERWQKKF